MTGTRTTCSPRGWANPALASSRRPRGSPTRPTRPPRTCADAVTAGAASNFTASLSDADRAQLANRFAVKHAHSQQNPEKDWGRYTLHAVEFAFYVLNEKFGEHTSSGTMRTIHPGRTIV